MLIYATCAYVFAALFLLYFCDIHFSPNWHVLYSVIRDSGDIIEICDSDNEENDIPLSGRGSKRVKPCTQDSPPGRFWRSVETNAQADTKVYRISKLAARETVNMWQNQMMIPVQIPTWMTSLQRLRIKIVATSSERDNVCPLGAIEGKNSSRCCTLFSRA